MDIDMLLIIIIMPSRDEVIFFHISDMLEHRIVEEKIFFIVSYDHCIMPLFPAFCIIRLFLASRLYHHHHRNRPIDVLLDIVDRHLACISPEIAISKECEDMGQMSSLVRIGLEFFFQLRFISIFDAIISQDREH